jgi:hypothetical protein
MWPSMPCTISWSRQTAGDAAILPRGVSCRQTMLPFRIEIARTVPFAFAM